MSIKPEYVSDLDHVVIGMNTVEKHLLDASKNEKERIEEAGKYLNDARKLLIKIYDDMRKELYGN